MAHRRTPRPSLTRGFSALAAVLVTAGCVSYGDAPDPPDADIAWEAPIDVAGDETPSAYATGKLVLMNTGKSLAAVSAATGAEQWTVEGPWDEVHVAEDFAVVRSEDHQKVSILDLKTGEPRSELETGGDGSFENLAVTGDSLVTNELSTDTFPDSYRVTAHDPATGGERWHENFDEEITVDVPVAARQPRFGDIVAVAPSFPRLYVNQVEGETVTLDAETGGDRETLAKPLPRLDAHRALRITDDGTLITQRYSDEKCAYTVDVDDGGKTRSTVFSAHSIDGLDDCGGADVAPWISGKSMCGGDEKGLPKLVDLATGKTTWHGEEEGDTLGCDDGVVVSLYSPAALNDNRVRGVDVKSGESWTYSFKDRRVAVADGLFVASRTTSADAIDLHTGKRLWQVKNPDKDSPAKIFGLLEIGSGLVLVLSRNQVLAVKTGSS